MSVGSKIPESSRRLHLDLLYGERQNLDGRCSIIKGPLYKNSMNYKIADISEIELILSLDEIHGTKKERKYEIERAVNENACYLVLDGSIIAGYGIFKKFGFLSEGFIELLVIHSHYRGKGYGESFIRYCERISEANRIHTSTNLSNLPMQNLLNKLGYTEGGRLINFDPDDPEIFYFKKIE